MHGTNLGSEMSNGNYERPKPHFKGSRHVSPIVKIEKGIRQCAKKSTPSWRGRRFYGANGQGLCGCKKVIITQSSSTKKPHIYRRKTRSGNYKTRMGMEMY